MSTPPGQDPGWLEHMRAGTEVFTAHAAGLDDEQVHQPSDLPGWTRAHVITHVARNADALVNLLTWARTGVPTPMYASSAQRAADIEDGATRPARDILADHTTAAQRLSDHIGELTDEQWTAPVRTASGRTVPAAEALWIRAREVWVHAADLGTGLQLGELPDPVTDQLLDEALRLLATREGCPNLQIVCTDSDQRWSLGSPGKAESGPPVCASRAELLPWVLGRRRSDPADAAEGWPSLPAWL